MGNAISYPKPDGQKVTRHAPKFDWTTLPARGRQGPAPKLPATRKWTKPTRDAWALLWSKPQAVAWDQDGSTMFAWAECHHDSLVASRNERSVSAIHGEMRQIEDRHGLNPNAMLQLRWRIVDDEGVVVSQPSEPSQGRTPARRRLTIVD